jgi:hypothetical protein
MYKRVAAALALALALASTAAPVLADGGGGGGGGPGGTGDHPSVSISTWTGPSGNGYLTFSVSLPGQPATAVPPKRSDTQSPYYMAWYTNWSQLAQDRGWLGGGLTCSYTIYRRSDDSIVTGGTAPCSATVGVPPSTTGGSLAGLLGVSVDPPAAPANTARMVTAQVSSNYAAGVNGALSGYVDESSVRILSWDIDYGGGVPATGTYSSGGAFQLSEPHTYGEGSFTVSVAAHMAGNIVGAEYDSSGQIYEVTRPFTLTLTNTAGTIGAPIEYIPPVVQVGSDPTLDRNAPGCARNCSDVPRDGKALASFYWLRGLPCTVYAAPIIIAEGYMRSGGVRIGGARTALASYDFSTGVNDRNPRVRSPNGSYAGNVPIEIQWNTPLGNDQPYALSYTYHLVTTYDDGTVKNYSVAGGVGVVIVYSVMG